MPRTGQIQLSEITTHVSTILCRKKW